MLCLTAAAASAAAEVHNTHAGLSGESTTMIHSDATTAARPRARELGISIGVLQPGPLNSITDVAGVRVGHTTLISGETVRTGVTAILPHGGNLFREKVPAGVHVGNGFGKFIGSTQVKELGELETPILLTSTLNAFRAADALVDYTLRQPGNEDVRSLNPVVGETNDGQLNDIQGRHVTRDHCLQAIEKATAGPVEEGAVGAGTGTVTFGFKGGIGTASRRLSPEEGGYTVGVLVQSNYGGHLMVAGVPVGVELASREAAASRKENNSGAATTGSVERDRADGSVIVVVATDAPVDSRNLERMAARTMLGLGRTGAAGSNGSGDYAVAFSVAPALRIRPGHGPVERPLLPNSAMSPLFVAVIEATEEAVTNSLLKAVSTTGCGKTAEALPLEETVQILRKHGRL